MPSTAPSRWLVASRESRPGTAMIFVGSWSFLPPPIWNSEKEHGWHEVHCASAAAIFIGWNSPSVTPSSLPTSRLIIVAGTRKAGALRGDRADAGGGGPGPRGPGGGPGEEAGPGGP